MGADVTADSEISAALARLAGEVKRLKRGRAALATNVRRGNRWPCARCCRCVPD